jgi:protein-tyrosine phosphatase
VLFRDLVKDAPDYAIQSAGVGAFSGQCASRHSAKLAKERGLDLSKHQSKAVTIDLVDQATHIFALGRSHVATLLMDYPEAEHKIYLLSEFAAEDQLRGKDVSDPFGGDLEEYREMQENLDKLLPSIHAFIEQTWKPFQS